MRISDLLIMGFRNLRRRKARTALTVIGMVIGTISIVVMISIGVGVNQSFRDSVLENGGMTLIHMSANSWDMDDNGNYTSTTQNLTDEVAAKMEEVEHVRSVSPLIQNYSIMFKTGKFQCYAMLYAFDFAKYEDLGFPALEDGTYPTKEDSSKIILGAEALEGFYYYSGGRVEEKDDVDLTKDKVTFTFSDYQPNERKKPFEEQIKDYAFMWSSSEEGVYNNYTWSVFIDIDHYKELYKKYANTLKINDRKQALAKLDKYEEIILNADNMNNVTEIQAVIKEMGYSSTSDMQYIEPMMDTANMLELVLGAIGFVAMLVSAINIANTMIMSIYERTKEIGVMKVLGCEIRDIKLLFLFEAGMMGFIGGVIGIGFSYIISFVLNKYGSSLLSSLFSSGGGELTSGISVIPFWLPFLAAFFAIFVAVISGYLPARRATKISAIEAMKTEG